MKKDGSNPLIENEEHFDLSDVSEMEPVMVRRVPQPRLKEPKSPETKTLAAAKAADFCRQARRLRAAYADDPVQMYERLKLLTASPDEKEARHRVRTAGQTDEAEDLFSPYTLLDAADPPMDDEEEADVLPGERKFRQLVAGRLIGRGAVILRYSERLDLLKEAKLLGLDRFNANLIIAAVENEAREIEPTLVVPGKRSKIRGWMVMVAAVQSFIAAGVWKLIRG